MPTWMGLGFQDSGSIFMNHIFFLHDHVMMIMFLIIFFVSYMMIYLLLSHYFYKYFLEGVVVESVWSIIPSFLLIFMVFPSMHVLYMMEDIKDFSLTVKVIGHQWYWSYVVPLFNNLSISLSNVGDYSFFEYDSIMDMDSVYPRLLGCSSDLVIPVGVVSRFLITSTDVIHSFAVPSLSMKVDAIPGRINQIFSYPLRSGVFFGQCSEICGSNHSFMPITIKVMDYNSFEDYSLSILVNDVLNVDLLSR